MEDSTDRRSAASPARDELLTVPGARLYLERRGAGPLLVCVVGGNGDAEVFARMAAALAGHFTVATYDRRGFVRSPVDGPVDTATRVAIDASDAAAVIAHCGGGPAYVFGSSSGAIVGLELLARHPASVRTLVAHEPPLATLLPDAARWLALFDHVHATYVASGVGPAMAEFYAGVDVPAPPTPPAGMQLPPNLAALLARAPVNQAFWLEHELRSYPRFTPDLPALAAARAQLVLGVGRDSRAAVLAQPARLLAAAVVAPVVEFTGGHVGYATAPATFATELAGALLGPG